MAEKNISGIKRIRQARKKFSYNNMIRNQVRKIIKDFEKIIHNNENDKIKEQYKLVVKTLDKATNKGIIHKNKAARKKSRLAKKIPTESK